MIQSQSSLLSPASKNQPQSSAYQQKTDLQFANIPGNTDEDYELDDYILPTFAKLVASTTPEAFRKVAPATMKNAVHLQSICLLPIPPLPDTMHL